MEALKATISIAANHKETFSVMHIDVSRAHFHAKAQRFVLVRLPVENIMSASAGTKGLLKQSMYGTRDAASNWGRDWQKHVGVSSKNLFHQERHQVSGMTHGDSFVLTGPTERLTEFENKMTGMYPTKAKVISHGSTQSIKALIRLHLGM